VPSDELTGDRAGEDPRAVTIVEVGPRDGLQNEERVLPVADKLALIGRSLAAGVRRVEVASMVNPARVPQMADAEAVIAGLAGIPEAARAEPIALVLNRRGCDRALAAGIGEINYVVGVTDAFDGEVPPQRVAEVAAEALQSRPGELALGDTVGVGVPSQVADLIARVRALPGADGVALRCHFHNTRNTGLANAYAAYSSGVRILDASTGGFGGCPFAPEATGNIPTEDLAWMLHRMGAPTGLELGALVETAAWLGGRLGRPVPALLGRAGLFPATT
jgi:hydroxymethylglutaryl-CoA lyase